MKTNQSREKSGKIFESTKSIRPSAYLYIYTFLLICTFAHLSICTFAQDIHFSQFSQTPLFLNPALTGGFNGDQRGILNYKNQWQSIGSPYRTYMISYDAGLMKKKWKTNYLGVGFTAFSDKAGNAELAVSQFNLSVADFVLIGGKQLLSVGLQGGYAQKSIDYNKLQWGNQFNGQVYDQSIDSKESITSTFSYWDISTGIAWNYSSGASTMSSNDVFRANVGIAAYHVNKPRQNMFAQNDDRLNPKFVVHGGVFIGISNTSGALIPSVLYLQQGAAKEINAGLMYRYLIIEESRHTKFVSGAAVSFGGYYRVGDAVVPALQIELGSLDVGVSYDVNISKLKAASNVRGGIEISLRYTNPNPFHYGGRGGSSGNVRFL